MLHWVLFTSITYLASCQGFGLLASLALGVAVAVVIVRSMTFTLRINTFEKVSASLLMSDPAQVSSVHAQIIIDRITPDEVRDIIRRQYLVYPPFHWGPRYSWLWGYHWVDVMANGTFSIDDHVIVYKNPVTVDDLRAHLTQELATGLPDGKPLWQLHHFVNYGENRSVLLFKFHHCYGDGLTLLRLWMQV